MCATPRSVALIIQPLINRIGAGGESVYGVLRIPSGAIRPSTSTCCCRGAINFVLIAAAVVYFLIVLPYSKFRKEEETVEAEVVLLTEIRDLLATRPGPTASERVTPDA